MKQAKGLLTALLLCLVSITTAAQGPASARADNREVIRMGLYPPDVLMNKQQQLGITDEQRSAIAKLVGDFQGQVTELQWAMPNEQQKLRELLSTNSIDPEVALEQAGKVMQMESQFKLAHFELLIAIKNELTEEQINMLDTAIRRRMEQREAGK